MRMDAEMDFISAGQAQDKMERHTLEYTMCELPEAVRATDKRKPAVRGEIAAGTAEAEDPYVYHVLIHQKLFYFWHDAVLCAGRTDYEGHAEAVFREAVQMTITLGVWVMSLLITASLSASMGFLLAACLRMQRDEAR